MFSKAKTDEPLVNYKGDENLLVVPITAFVRKDGNVALVDEEAKVLAAEYPDMTRYFGQMLGLDVPYPVFRRKDINVMGVVDRTHYASAPDEDLITAGFSAILEACEEYSNMLVYLFPFGGDKERNEEVFADAKNVVLLEKE